MKYLFIVFSLVLYHRCVCRAYHFEGEIPEGILSENETTFLNWLDLSNDTESNVSLPRDFHELVKDIVEKIKDSFKDVKDNLGNGFDRIKEKIKNLKDTISDGINRIKKRIQDFKITDDDETVGPDGLKDVKPDDKDELTASDDSNAKWFMLGIGTFAMTEKAFQIKSVPDELKAEILLNILGERVNNLLPYVSQEDLSNYVKIKELILREFEPTPQECLSNFKKARKLPSENYVQFASRLSATFDYYCQLRKVNEFRSLCDLIISDKIFETLNRDTMNHIATKQGETYFKPQQLERECDVYLSARGKVSNDLMSRNPGRGVKTDGQNRLQTVSTWRQERNSSNVFVAETKTNCVLCKGNNFHPLSKCYQFKKLSVEDRVEVVKRNNLCFRCFLPHRLKECRSEKNCFCLRPHNSLIHFSRDKTRNPTPTSNLNLVAPTFVPGQIEGSVEANSQSKFVATGFEKGRLKNVFLSIVRALVKNKYSQWVEVRCLLDVGSVLFMYEGMC
ncbi:integrase catalytic domain-containing protein [Trichonephila clavipes]|nr:integrase catalytic domain-containing protein [Trichonephila clavipes]